MINHAENVLSINLLTIPPYASAATLTLFVLTEVPIFPYVVKQSATKNNITMISAVKSTRRASHILDKLNNLGNMERASHGG